MSNNPTTIREISWREIFPWLILLRVFRLAIRPSVLLMALLPIILMPWGSWCATQLFDHPTHVEENAVEVRVPSLLELTRVAPAVGRQHMESLFHQVNRPFHEVLRTHSLRETAYWLFVGLWSILLWAIPAGAMSRIAVVRLGREERVGFIESLGFSVRRIGAYVGAPLLPLVGFTLCALPVALLGLMMRADWGVLIAGVLWVFVLVAGFAMTLMLLGLFFGWPLMWPTISAEFNGDLFEALQRSYDYTRERPLHYLFYAFVATMLGALGWLVVNAVCIGVVDISSWAVTWGAGGVERMEEISRESENTTVVIGMQCIHVLSGLVLQKIPTAYAASFFWCSASAIYLLLRQDVDQTEMDEVFLAEPEEEPPLPDLDASFTAAPSSSA